MENLLEQIKAKKMKNLTQEEKFEKLKLRLCINSMSVFDILSNNYDNIADRISILLDLDEEEKQMLDHIRLTDLNLQTISNNLLAIKAEKEKL